MKMSRNSGKIFLGIFFILAAVYIVACKIWPLPSIGVFSIILTVFFLWMFVNGVRHVNFWEILFSIAFMCIIYAKPLGITAITPWPVLGAALLGSIGLSMIFHKRGSWNIGVDTSDANFSTSSNEQCSGEQIRCENSFGTAIKYINSENFCNASLENNFGSLSVYFDNAVIQSGSANVEVENNFGETNLYIPKEWKVVNNMSRSFGSVTEKGRYEGSSNCTLYINGEANFGSICIHYI